jgi:hypothetical protein
MQGIAEAMSDYAVEQGLVGVELDEFIDNEYSRVPPSLVHKLVKEKRNEKQGQTDTPWPNSPEHRAPLQSHQRRHTRDPGPGMLLGSILGAVCDRDDEL